VAKENKNSIPEKNEKKIPAENTVDARSFYPALLDGMSQSYVCMQTLYDENNTPYDFLILDCNRNFLSLSNQSQQIIGKTLFSILPDIKNDKFNFKEFLSKQINSGEKEKVEFHSEFFNRWFIISKFSPDGNYICVLFEDISRYKLQEIKSHLGEHKLLEKNTEISTQNETIKSINEELLEVNSSISKTQKKLIASEELFFSIFQNASDGIFLISDNGCIYEWNKQCELITGYKKEEVIKKYAWDFQLNMIPHEKRTNETEQEYKHIILDFFKTGKAEWLNISRRADIVSKNNKICNIHFSYFSITLSKGIMLGCIFHDLTEFYQIQKKVFEQESDLEAIISSLENVIFELDKDYRFLNVWASDKSFLFFEDSFFLGKTLRAVFDPEFSAKFEAIINDVFRNGIIQNIEYPSIIEGDNRWYSAKICLIRHQGGMPDTVSVLISDITERKNREIQLQQSLEEASHYQNTLLELIRHENIDFKTDIARLNEINAATLQVDFSSVWLFNEEETALQCVDSFCLSKSKHEEGTILDITKYPIYLNTIKNQRNLVVEDVLTDERTIEFKEDYSIPNNIKALVDTPIWLRGKIIGVLCAEVTTERHWTYEDQVFTASIADMVAVSLIAEERKNFDAILQDKNEQLKFTIHNLQQLNRQLKESEEKFKALSDMSPAVIVIYKAENILYANDATITLTGYSRDEILNSDIWRFVDTEDVGIVSEITLETRLKSNTRAPKRIEFKIKTKNNDIRWLDFSVGIIEFSGEYAVIGTAFDITERKLAELELKDKSEEIAIQMEEHRSLNAEYMATNENIHRANNVLQQTISRLRDSESRYTELFDKSADGYFIMKEVIHDCNQKACELFEMTRKELIGAIPNELAPVFQPDGRKSSESGKEKISACLNGKPQFFNWKHKKKDGSLFDAEITYKLLSLKDDVLIIATIRDISTRLKSELKIKENEKKLSEVYQVAMIGSWQLDLNKREITLSKEHQLLIGLDSLSALPLIMPLMEYAEKFIAHKDIPLLLEKFQRASITENHEESNEPFEYTFIHPSGEICIMEVHAKFFDKGIIYGITQDITERRRTEEIMQSTDVLLKSINTSAQILLTEENHDEAIGQSLAVIGNAIGLSSICIYSHLPDSDEQPVFNHRVEWTSEQLLFNDPDLQNVPYASLGIERWFVLLSSKENIKGRPKDFPLKERMFLDKKEILSFLAIPILIENKYWGFIGFSDKMQMRKWSSSQENILVNFANTLGGAIANKIRNEEILRSKEQAMEADRLKTAFLANMSHEIRTPMNAILGFTDLLKDESLPTYKRSEFVDIINKRGKDLLNIINDIIDISKIEAGQIVIQDTECSLNAILFELYNFFESDITLRDKKDIILRLQHGLDNSGCFVLLDDFRLKQIFTNLIGNSVKFTEKGFIEFGYKIEGNKICFYVEDTGIGISEQKQSLIFDRFRQADDSTTKHYGGTGLGLAISKSLVELMNGYMELVSAPDCGSKFSFCLPYRKVSPKHKETKQAEEKSIIEQNWDAKVILIVEDDHVNFHYLKTLLKKTKAKILRAENGQEAIDICKENQSIQMVLMDMQMPVMNGFEATKIIKEIRKDLPVIAQTAYAMAEDKEKCFAAGCDDYITKPITLNSLLCVSAKYLNN